MSKLTTHVLDLYQGQPAAGLRIDFYRLDPDERRTHLREAETNSDGRLEAPLLEGSLPVGNYELLFHVGAYFAKFPITLPVPPFLDRVPIRFGLADAAANYHVPLLVSPWGYSTYKGS